MTQTTSRVPGQRGQRRPGSVYGRIYGHDTRRVDRRTGLVVDGVEHGYVGSTVRDVDVRDGEHQGRPGPDGVVKPSGWRDLSPGPYVIEEGWFPSVEALRAREAWHIAQRQPLYNDKANPRPDRIRRDEARRHRDARNAAAGLSPIVWPEDVRVDPTVVRSSRWRTVWRALRLPISWLLLAWFVVSAVLIAAGVEAGVTGVVPLVAVSSLAAAVVVVVAWICGWRRSKRRRRR